MERTAGSCPQEDHPVSSDSSYSVRSAKHLVLRDPKLSVALTQLRPERSAGVLYSPLQI
jgi:hypothetical protein